MPARPPARLSPPSGGASASGRMVLAAVGIAVLVAVVHGSADSAAEAPLGRDRVVPAVESGVRPAGLNPCRLKGHVPDALLRCRNWITFAPPRPFNPNRGTFPTERQLRTVLRQLVRQGWRGLVTYSFDGSLSEVPRIAREVGFRRVIAGLFWFDRAQLARERRAAVRERAYVDGFVLGNEGLDQGRYSRRALGREMRSLRAATDRPVTTTEPAAEYDRDPSLLELGDWVFPTIHPWFASIRSPEAGVDFVAAEYERLATAAPGRVIVIKEAWWPTCGGSGAGAGNQVLFFRELAGEPVRFVWGEAYDQYWKRVEGPQGPCWGLHTSRRREKPIIEELRETFAGRY